MLLWLCYKDACFRTPFFRLPKLDNTKKDNSEILTVRANKMEDGQISHMHVYWNGYIFTSLSRHVTSNGRWLTPAFFLDKLIWRELVVEKSQFWANNFKYEATHLFGCKIKRPFCSYFCRACVSEFTQILFPNLKIFVIV